MTDDKQREIFRRNLTRYIGNTPQADVAKAIGVSPQTFNTWMVGKAVPRFDKVQMLAEYFGIRKSDLLEEPTGEVSSVVEEHIRNYSQLNPEWQALIDELIAAAQAEPRDSDKVLELTQKVMEFLRS